MTKGWLTVVVVALFVLLPAAIACKGGGAETQISSGEIKIEAGEFYFKPSALTVKAGTPVKFVVTNAGKIVHNFHFRELLGQDMKAEIEVIQPGTTKTLEMTFSQGGTYTFECGITGHAESGMKGTLTVVK